MMLVPRRNFDLFDDIFDDSFFIPKNDNKMMRTDIEEKDNNYELAIDLPGMKKDNVKISLEDGYLTIHAKQESKNDEKDKHGKYIDAKDIMVKHPVVSMLEMKLQKKISKLNLKMEH